MHRLLPTRRAWGLALGLALVPLALSGVVRAANSTPVKFETRDGVEIHGTYYPSKSANVKDLPVVLLLHRLGGHSHQDGWDSLAEAIQKEGYPVLSFDFRGHGKSTTIGNPKAFWGLPYNAQRVSGFSLSKPKTTLAARDFKGGYQPYLVNDIAAAKLFLDERNDAGECNSRAVIVIGAETGASLGALWMATEWYRHPASSFNPITRLPLNVDTDKSEGKDQFAAVWLTLSPVLPGTTGGAVRSWLTTVGRTNKVPMAFLHGEKDEAGGKVDQDFVRHLKGNDKASLPYTDVAVIKGTNLKGSQLLRKELNTESLIVETYLRRLREAKKEVPNWRRRDFSISGYAWTFPNGFTVPAKSDQEKTNALEPVPVERFLSP